MKKRKIIKLHKMSEKSFMGGAPRSPGAGTSPRDTSRHILTILQKAPLALGFINTTPDEEGGQGQEG